MEYCNPKKQLQFLVWGWLTKPGAESTSVVKRKMRPDIRREMSKPSVFYVSILNKHQCITGISHKKFSEQKKISALFPIESLSTK